MRKLLLILTLLFALLFNLTLTSCDKDEDLAPPATYTEPTFTLHFSSDSQICLNFGTYRHWYNVATINAYSHVQGRDAIVDSLDLRLVDTDLGSAAYLDLVPTKKFTLRRLENSGFSSYEGYARFFGTADFTSIPEYDMANSTFTYSLAFLSLGNLVTSGPSFYLNFGNGNLFIN